MNDGLYKLIMEDIKKLIPEDKQESLITNINALLADIRNKHEIQYNNLNNRYNRALLKNEIFLDVIDDLDESVALNVYKNIINEL